MGQTITLSALEYDVLWEHLQLGPFPPIFELDSHGATLEERAELTAEAWESLADKELGWPTAVDGRVVFRLRMLARPEWEVDARLRRPDGRTVSALIAANPATTTTATIAIRDEDRLTLRTFPAGEMIGAAVSLLPPHPPGTGVSITLPAETLDAAVARSGRDPASLARTLISSGLGKSEAYKIADLAAGTVGFAHFGAARTRTFDRRRRAGHVVSVYDTTAGRYLFTRKPTGAQRWVTLVPGTPSALTRQLDELLAELS
ncbi:MAG TPA: ESX secretion-associated protein EspG [Actinophytocola sp.]|uniref:ESX secretion-associated protein EspG n=1 Tax=Actinophytocola sp. TaxID=1872138 RepID=UPI002DDCE25C|nr:ESX secretion-associated protein EspG [Actinophytocola sp.]HEV2783739.1 ESX secretion-associated protein EspG [Actinophytocola sp.]